MSQLVIGFHYTLKDKEGNLIDTSENQAPLLFLVGSGHIIPGLEKELLTMNVGDKKNVVVPAADAYGELVEELQITVNRNQFPEGADLKVGDQFQVTNEEHAPIFTIMHIEGEEVHIDGNHPMAGKELHFAVEITDRRNATDEEVAHGHAHGEGGHHH
jgi:FKBP-type peptidyl-prolyl cis-trans isomerase SlyD